MDADFNNHIFSIKNKKEDAPIHYDVAGLNEEALPDRNASSNISISQTPQKSTPFAQEISDYRVYKGEEVCINLERVMYYTESRKGVLVTMEDGMIFDVALTMQDFNFRLKRREIAVFDTTEN